MDIMNEFPRERDPMVEKSLPVTGNGSHVVVEYSSNQAIELRTSFLFSKGETISLHPLYSLWFQDIPAGDQRVAVLDITASPEWRPGEQELLLHIRGFEGAEVQIHSIQFLPASLLTIASAGIRHLFSDEAVQLTSAYHRWGYQMLNATLAGLLGFTLLFAVAGYWLLVSGYANNGGMRIGVVFCMAVISLLIYDARFSLNLVRTNAQDLAGWIRAGEYRQLGPVHAMADALRVEEVQSVGICTDLEDLYQKQLRYHLYPIPVNHTAESRESASHIAFIGKRHDFDGTVRCHEDEESRAASLVGSYGGGNDLYRVLP